MSSSLSSSTNAESVFFDRTRHIRFFSSCLHQLPAPYAKLDTNRLTLVHFAVHALDVLGVWDDYELQLQYQLDKERILCWIVDCLHVQGGFQGGTYVGPTSKSASSCTSSVPFVTRITPYHRPHIAMTYCALLILPVLDPEGTWLDRRVVELSFKDEILRHLQELQRPDGSFGCIVDPSEQDMRFLYCACAICYLLQDWSAINVDLAVQYIQSCRAYDGGIALVPGQEGHGGSTFCGLAALVLMGKLEQVVTSTDWNDQLIHWCVHRQVNGMQGRPNKLEDSCYSYWIGGSLRLLLSASSSSSSSSQETTLLNLEALQQFILSCQAPASVGGFAKAPGGYPDILHSFYSLAWLCLSNHQEREIQERDGKDGKSTDHLLPLHRLNATLGIRQDRVEQWQRKMGLESQPLP